MASTPVTGRRWRTMQAGASVPVGSLPSDRSTALARALDLAPAGLAGVALATSCLMSGDLSALRVVLATGLLAHALAAVVGLRMSAGAAGLFGVAQASAVFCFTSTVGAIGWPAMLWLLAAPIAAWRAGHRGATWAAIAAVGSTFGLLSSAGYLLAGDALDGMAGEIAAAYLVGTSLIATLWRPGRQAEAGWSRDARQALELTGDLVTRHDAQGDVLAVLGSAAVAFGMPARSLVGAGLFDRVHIPDRPGYLKALSDAANGAGPARAKIRLRAGSGEPAAICCVSMTAERVGADVPEVLAVFRYAAESDRQAAAAEAALREAAGASELKSRFLASVTHELRTPLNAIIGFSELLSADHPFVLAEERRREYAAIIRDSGGHLLDVVNTLLDMSKIESGHFAYAPEPFDLAALARSCCDLLQLKAEQAGISFVQRIASGMPDTVADRRACRQILINLISNAVKFSALGGLITIEIRREGGAVILAVSDDGIGIREADLARLGEPFFQAGEPHRLSKDGTGLGLSVVSGLVGLHRGVLSVESGPGLGTTVTVELPALCVVEAGPGGPARLRTIARRPAPSLQRKSA